MYKNGNDYTTVQFLKKQITFGFLNEAETEL